MLLRRISAFSDGDSGGNPAGVWVGEEMGDSRTMQRIAARIGYSETVFASPLHKAWRVRYFSPESEVPFCGHATIALGAALALDHGDGVFALVLNDAHITVEGYNGKGRLGAILQSPHTRSETADPELVKEALKLFGYAPRDLDPRLPPAIAYAGAPHLLLALSTRRKLASMSYDLAKGREFMRKAGVVTVGLLYAATSRLFDARHAFASGGVYEDPATGAGAAALAGYLRDISWPHGGAIEIVQGEDMGSRSLLRAEFTRVSGSSIRVSGSARFIDR
ncbi:MAG TPA: PhzF family phenazine biosynthesis protein [Xanthomonadaceae bacterium]|jgi:PhzF family phenazine biosynthesis protein